MNVGLKFQRGTRYEAGTKVKKLGATQVKGRWGGGLKFLPGAACYQVGKKFQSSEAGDSKEEGGLYKKTKIYNRSGTTRYRKHFTTLPTRPKKQLE